MSAPQFTPGPWIAEEGDDGYEIKGGGLIATTGFDDQETELANARLIAAAPELYEALDDALAFIRGDIQGHSQQAGIYREGKRALAKARGEQ